MKIWLGSHLIHGPATPVQLADDLIRWARTGDAPDHMFPAVVRLTFCTPPKFVNGLSIITGVGCPDRLLFLGRPGETEFEVLERFLVLELDGGGVVMHVCPVH